MSKKAVQRFYLKDYQPSPFQIDEVMLTFELDPVRTRVTGRYHMRREQDAPAMLRLNAEEVQIEQIRLNGQVVPAALWTLNGEVLEITAHFPEQFELEIVSLINPKENTQLEGLYLSNGIFCTQCEAEGFRRIIPFLDRPDILSRYTVKIIADPERCPVLLSNGNRIETGQLEDGRHYAVWRDPWPKPCYLFALVAGQLDHVEDRFTTAEGREVTLNIWVEPHNIDKCEFAMGALKRAMRWDETRFGLCYDLDVYNIVAVDDFNMGAMENKSLNVFNSRYVLARPDTATDQDYEGIESVIAHEYFHNWTGNRVTCRNWFQLTLKEGLTVFRDQEFTADMLLPSIKRIDDVNYLRTYQFPEDASPMAHPIQPKSYIKMDNFYTHTVYDKGAEVVRLYQTLLGREGFRRGMDLYFQRHDGQAVTVDDFRAAMADANGVDLSQMRRWYDEVGTPQVRVERVYDAESGTLTLSFEQSLPCKQPDPNVLPLLIPIRMGLLSAQGEVLPLHVREGAEACLSGRTPEECVFQVREKRQKLVLEQVPEGAIPAILRDFSAPVELEMPWTEAELSVLAAHDPDDFLRWEALHQLAVKTLKDNVARHQAGEPMQWSEAFMSAVEARLEQALTSPAWHARALQLPEESYIGDQYEIIPVEAVHQVHQALAQSLADRFYDQWAALYDRLYDPERPYVFDAEQYGQRSLQNLALHYLVRTGREKWLEQADYHYRHATNMTDRYAALSALAETDHPLRQQVLEDFYYRFREDGLVVNKWFRLQASVPRAETLNHVKVLTAHPAFNYRNPNRVRSLLTAFGMNRVAFHRADGESYRFYADEILKVDRLNPQIAARLLSPLMAWRRYDTARRSMMLQQLERILQAPGLSRNCYEIVERALE